MTLQEQFNQFIYDGKLNEAMNLFKDNSKEIDPSDWNNYAIHKAVEMEHTDFVEFLYLDDRVIFEELPMHTGYNVLRLIELKTLKDAGIDPAKCITIDKELSLSC